MAQLTARKHLLIEASPEVVWKVHTDVNRSAADFISPGHLTAVQSHISALRDTLLFRPFIFFCFLGVSVLCWYLGGGWAWVAAEQFPGHENETRGARAALKGAVCNKRFLDWMELAVRANASAPIPDRPLSRTWR